MLDFRRWDSSPPAAVRWMEPPAVRPNPVTNSIVLADDDEGLRAVYVPCLRSAGYDVWEAADGQEAVKLVREHRPALLLLDLWMPTLNGFEVLEELRNDEAASRLKVLMFSICRDADARLESFGFGAVGFLIKGLSLAEMQERVRQTLAGREAPWWSMAGGA